MIKHTIFRSDVPSSQKSNEKKTADKQPVFVENERRHYQEGELWKDDDEEQIGPV